MKECLLCKRDMKTSKSLFGNGCIKSIYKLLNLDMPQKVKDMEHHLSKYIMKQVNITKLNTIQKQWLTDRYLTYQYIDNLKYGDYTELKEELKCDISNVGEIVEFSEFKTAEKIEFIDTYDYTKFKTMMDYYKDANSVPKSALSSILYNIAFFEMKFGLMREYKVIVKFEINDYEVR